MAKQCKSFLSTILVILFFSSVVFSQHCSKHAMCLLLSKVSGEKVHVNYLDLEMVKKGPHGNRTIVTFSHHASFGKTNSITIKETLSSIKAELAKNSRMARFLITEDRSYILNAKKVLKHNLTDNYLRVIMDSGKRAIISKKYAKIAISKIEIAQYEDAMSNVVRSSTKTLNNKAVKELGEEAIVAEKQTLSQGVESSGRVFSDDLAESAGRTFSDDLAESAGRTFSDDLAESAGRTFSDDLAESAGRALSDDLAESAGRALSDDLARGGIEVAENGARVFTKVIKPGIIAKIFSSAAGAKVLLALAKGFLLYLFSGQQEKSNQKTE